MDNAGRNSILSGQNRRSFSRNQIRNAVVISIVLVLGFQWRLLVSVTGTLMTAVRQTPTSFIRQGHFVLGTCGRSSSSKVDGGAATTVDLRNLTPAFGCAISKADGLVSGVGNNTAGRNLT
ncbi:LOW QUALITY PROTEIN: hypothetical protein RJ640_006754 [Escallonia rubra]|uniref:Uncharacterized protein n=1 Tax=Escallonia rubra TaxID=112253 RepID=A0AA88U1J8_9ASTE|nr:LOW QUALITY PROTEIN: hypothetical protein RJ640_006754 [Escallonia rubra]